MYQTGEEQSLNELRKIRHDKLKRLKESGKDPFVIERVDISHYSNNIKKQFEELEDQPVTIAGRIMTRREHGKATFINLQDKEGQVQGLYQKGPGW